jgi:hypothetical protein
MVRICGRFCDGTSDMIAMSYNATRSHRDVAAMRSSRVCATLSITHPLHVLHHGPPHLPFAHAGSYDEQCRLFMLNFLSIVEVC